MMLDVRKSGILSALLAAVFLTAQSPALGQDAVEYYRLVAAGKNINTKSLNPKESKDRGVVVYVMRGWLDVFSTGMDDLADKMKRRGINAVAMSHSDHLTVAAEIIARHKQGIKERPVLVGHSLGANATASMATELSKAGIHVPLIVMFDPTVVQSVPSNVGRAVNFYQSNNGWGVKVEAARGFRGKLENIDLYKEELGHTGIDKSPKLHLQSISYVQGLRGVRDSDLQEAARPRQKLETAGGETKSTTPVATGEQKAVAGPSGLQEVKPAALAPLGSSIEPKTSAASAASESKPAEKTTTEKPSSASSNDSSPPGLFSDVKRPTL